MQTTHRSRKAGFTLPEVLAVVGIIIIMVALLLPARPKRGRGPCGVACVSNMKQTTLAFIVWMHDNEKANFPFRVDWRNGGTRYSGDDSAPAWAGQQNRLFFQYAWLSNQLENPKLLVCPSEKQKRVAVNWSSTDPHSGFLHGNQRDNSVSYNLWMDGGYINGTLSFENAQDQILLSDRHLTDDGQSTSCSSGISPVKQIVSQPNPTGKVRWKAEKNFGHGVVGSLGLLDGSVASVNQSELGELFRRGDADAGVLHYMFPQ